MNQQLRQILLDLQQADQDTRARLVKEGILFEGYAEEMATVHEHNAQQLQNIIDQVGWPGQSLVGKDGAQAAWLIAQHAISKPEFQRYCLELIRQAVRQEEMLPQTEAYLTDRIRFNERRPQVYGTIFDWDEEGDMSPWCIEDPQTVEKQRKNMSLSSLTQSIQEARKQAHEEGNTPPADYEARQQEINTWAKRVGWLE